MKEGATVEVDELVCEGSAVCEMLAPDVFRVDDDDIAKVLRQPDSNQEAEVQDAIDRCPKQALRLIGA